MSLSLLTGESRTPVLIALVIGLILRVVFIITTPFNEPERIGKLSAYNDEPAHVEYTSHIVRFETLPRTISPITQNLHGSLPTFENYQSPLAYILHALACKPFDVKSADSIAIIGRWLSLAYMVLLLLVAATIFNELGRAVSSESRSIFIIFLALSGVFVRFSSLAGNEMLAWLMFGWIIMAYLSHERYASSRNFYWLIIAFILGLYVKLSVLLFAPIVGLVIARTYSANHGRAVIGALYVLITCIPLAAYNYFVFGSPIPLAAGFGEPVWRMPDLNSLMHVSRSAVFPWSELWRNWIGLALFAPALILLGWVAFGIIKKMRESSWAFLISVISLSAFAWLNLRYDQAEGRYLFVAWPAFIIGVEALPHKLRSPWLWLLMLLLPYLLFVF
ncbi:MAG: hypothetical protein IPP40_02645 [bacterium]|nr:hypothetical protein [bacterium]